MHLHECVFRCAKSLDLENACAHGPLNASPVKTQNDKLSHIPFLTMVVPLLTFKVPSQVFIRLIETTFWNILLKGHLVDHQRMSLGNEIIKGM